MKKIYLFCSAGMSTGMLAGNMQEVANQHKLPIEVKAYSIAKMDEIYEQKHPDCILLGPQVKFLYENTRKIYEKKHTPVGIVDMKDYGLMNGEAVLKYAIKLMKKG